MKISEIIKQPEGRKLEFKGKLVRIIDNQRVVCDFKIHDNNKQTI
jgi:hypothetical protein